MSLNRSWARYSSRVQRGSHKSLRMMSIVRLLFVCLSLGFAVVAAPPAAMAEGRCEGVSSAQGVSFSTVVSNIRKRLRDPGGRPLKACTERRGGNAVIKVKWLTSDDRLLDVTVDARTGAILGVRGN